MNVPNTAELLEKFIKKLNNKDFTEAMDASMCLSRQCFIRDIDADVGDAVDNFIRYWNTIDNENNIPAEQRKPIKIYINSPGGSLTATFQMVDAIENSITPIWTICTSTAYSGGFFTFIAGHRRFAYPRSSFLYHEGSVANHGDAGKFRNFAAFYEKQLEELKNVVLKHTLIKEDEYENHKKDDWWFTADEAIEKGICDEIL